MLIEFRASNYKTFRDEFVFSLIPAPELQSLDYSILKETVNGKEYKGLCSSVIYGPNAAGKTNIIEAIDTFRIIVLRGHIRNFNDGPTFAENYLEAIPHIGNRAPVNFYIKFIEKENLVEYSISLDLGMFSQRNYKRKVLEEKLVVNDVVVFTRKDGINFGDLHLLTKFLPEGAVSAEPLLKELSENSLKDDELFLTNGFKSIVSINLASFVLDWISGKLMSLCRMDAMQVVRSFNEQKVGSFYVDKPLNDALKLFGVENNQLAYMTSEESGRTTLMSVLKLDDKNATALPAECFESFGTLRFTELFPLVTQAIQTGGVLLIDECDMSIHPMAIMSLVNVFHNDSLNIHHAQLVFNTQNPIFLNSNLFRRDEIKFVERNSETLCSELYSLSDFDGDNFSNEKEFENYMTNYFASRYGAILNIDFSPVVESIISSEKEV